MSKDQGWWTWTLIAANRCNDSACGMGPYFLPVAIETMRVAVDRLGTIIASANQHEDAAAKVVEPAT